MAANVVAEGKPMDAATALPTGTVTFLFTDIEGSTQLAQHLGDRWLNVLEDHHRLLRAAWQAHDGHEVRTMGDAFFVVFPSPAGALVQNQGTGFERCGVLAQP